MKISIDDEVVSKYKRLSVDEVLCCLMVKNGSNPIAIAKHLIQRGILSVSNDDPNKFYIDLSASKMCDSIILDSDKSIPLPKSIDSLVDELQKLFPEGKKIDEYGEPKYRWRGNKKDVAKKLQAFFKLYGDFDFDKVIKATENYVKQHENDKTFMKILPYFIMKNNESLLATELEGLEDEEEDNSDWTNTVLLAN